jgi:putative nucleotidyltransferase with HDIG domain
MTAAVAEQAALSIGENPILARVASYYHDIGKLQNPEYFIENQNGAKNPHDGLSTSMSTLILTSHIKDGIALAKKHNLDRDIIDCIAQHHGSTVMSYFYRKERELNGGENHLQIDDFRYPGPKPQTKMAAIIMISDSCEAACRSLDDITAARVGGMVDKIVMDKLEDEQFSECSITLKELQLIKESAMTTLISMYHSRIKYEETDDKDEQDER